MPDEQTNALIEQLLERVVDLEIAASKPDQPWAAHLEPFYDQARRNIRDRAFAQIEHECQTPNAEKSKQSSGEVS